MKLLHQRLWLSGSLLILLLVHLIPLLRAPLWYFGYDYGFYLYAISHADKLNSFTLFGWTLGGYGNPLFYLTYHLHLPPEITLQALLVLAALVCGYLLYPLLQPYGAGLWAVLLFALSIPQTEVFSMFLLKTLVGLAILLAVFYCIQKNKYYWLILLLPLLLFVHRTTSIICLASLFVFGVYKLLKKRYYKLFFSAIALLAAVLFLLWHWTLAHQFLASFLNNPNQVVTEGFFMNGKTFWFSVWPYALLALGGAWLGLKQKLHLLFFSFLMITLLWQILSLPFHNRVLIYLDIALIIFASYFISQVRIEKKYRYILIVVAFGLLSWQTITYQLQKRPLITASEVKEIQNFSNTHPKEFVLALDSTDAPWLLAYSTGVRLAAPGLFEDNHSFQAWQGFWSGQKQQDFLNSFPKPLAIYHRSLKPTEDLEACLEPVSENFSEFICN